MHDSSESRLVSSTDDIAVAVWGCELPHATCNDEELLDHVLQAAPAPTRSRDTSAAPETVEHVRSWARKLLREGAATVELHTPDRSHPRWELLCGRVERDENGGARAQGVLLDVSARKRRECWAELSACAGALAIRGPDLKIALEEFLRHALPELADWGRVALSCEGHSELVATVGADPQTSFGAWNACEILAHEFELRANAQQPAQNASST